MTRPPAGLCDTCAHQQLVRTGRGSEFSLCRRSRSDPRFPKYPRVPVARCAGYERPEGGGDARAGGPLEDEGGP